MCKTLCLNVFDFVYAVNAINQQFERIMAWYGIICSIAIGFVQERFIKLKIYLNAIYGSTNMAPICLKQGYFSGDAVQ